MRLQPARYLFAALVAIAVATPLAQAQDVDPGALSVTLDLPVATMPPPAIAPETQTPAPAARTNRVVIGRPVIVLSAAATADWASTAWSLSHPTSREDNPLIAWAKAPGAIIAAGAIIDAVGAYA